MTQLAVEAACYSDLALEIKYYDTDNSGGVEWPEFLALLENVDDN